MASSRGGQQVMRMGDMEKMSLEQLKAVKEQADVDVNLLQDSLNNIRTATARLEIASTSLHDLSLRPQGKKMLVPLTASLYVPGTLDDADKVLVDIGTGYFVEKTMAEGKDYCERKINLLKSNFDQLVELVEFIMLDGKPDFGKGRVTLSPDLVPCHTCAWICVCNFSLRDDTHAVLLGIRAIQIFIDGVSIRDTKVKVDSD
ncbi:hypothetical protein POUND7_015959 [Theobroma cacao]